MVKFILICSLFILTFSICAIIYRLIKGPTAPDRIQALDALGIHMIAGVAILSILLRTKAFFEVILLIGILSFIGTIAAARFIERGYVIERKHVE